MDDDPDPGPGPDLNGPEPIHFDPTSSGENSGTPSLARLRYVRWIFIFSVAGLSFWLTNYLMSSVKQPIAFSHKRHVVLNPEETRRDCLSCHIAGYDEPGNAKPGDTMPVLYNKFLKNWQKEVKRPALLERRMIREPGMVIPRLNQCAVCHGESDDADQQGKKKSPSKDLLKLREHIKMNRPIPWKRNYRLKNHVVFSHARHVGFAQLKCSQCHGDVKNLEQPINRPRLSTLDMDTCMSCHKKKGAKILNDCLSCHR